MSEMHELLAVMARLRDPERGCPWDRAQSYASIVPHTIEEAYEVADAIERGDFAELRAELGDLLFQVVFYARIAEEEGRFGFGEVVESIVEKLVRRHPHVFADESIGSPEAQSRAWEAHKAQERAARAAARGAAPSALDGVSRTLPGTTRALKLQKRAARHGFDWPSAAPVLDKLREEIAELEAEIGGDDAQALADELGDLLFTCVNLARKLGVEPEGALRGANAKFERRFRGVEQRLGGMAALDAAALDAMEAAWQAVKAEEG